MLDEDKDSQCESCGGGYLCHQWGCTLFDWDALNNAMKDINISYKIQTNGECYASMKEKYSTIRYEWPEVWIRNKEEWKLFDSIIKLACEKYPHIKDYITDDWDWIN